MPAAAPAPEDLAERLIRSAEHQAAHQLQSELFFREFALHLAKQATAGFRRGHNDSDDGASVVQSFLEHEQELGRMKRGEVTTGGAGFRVQAEVHACQYQKTCQMNHHELGEVPQCVRAITLIHAIGARIPERPPMTYDLRPGLVDGTANACEIRLRPAGLPDLEPLRPGPRRP